MKKLDRGRHYLIEKINRNELMRKKHKKFQTTLNHTAHFLISVSTVTEWTSIPASAFLVGIPIGIMNCKNEKV